ncbi:hypothetical protein VTL71DRAFT_15851 [Oculimacula yallundae]|uniref:Uncharacterized protein n=1 Tax=Oculimacula yallundae TaxID=86028 RepID=A0ABR4CCU4_9HELO
MININNTLMSDRTITEELGLGEMVIRMLDTVDMGSGILPSETTGIRIIAAMGASEVQTTDTVIQVIADLIRGMTVTKIMASKQSTSMAAVTPRKKTIVLTKICLARNVSLQTSQSSSIVKKAMDHIKTRTHMSSRMQKGLTITRRNFTMSRIVKTLTNRSTMRMTTSITKMNLTIEIVTGDLFLLTILNITLCCSATWK